jgi:hypothetical protein
VSSKTQGLLINQTLSLEGTMPIALPESVRKVLEDKAYGHVITFNPNGRPQVTMVWMDVEGNTGARSLDESIAQKPGRRSILAHKRIPLKRSFGSGDILLRCPLEGYTGTGIFRPSSGSRFGRVICCHPF